MDAPERESSSLDWLGWPMALLILLGASVVEALPYIAGTGTAAKFDWAWIYVTTHFVVLPLLCVAHIAVNAYRVLTGLRLRPRAAMLTALSMIITVGYLVVLYLSPVFPLSNVLKFEELGCEAGVRQ